MIVNYDSPYRGRNSRLGKKVDEVGGPPPWLNSRAMRKSWLATLLFMMLMIPFGSFAQNINNYVFSTSNTGSLEDLTTGATSITTGNQDTYASSVLPIGFDFWFMGVKYSHYSVGSNGILKLSTSSGDSAISSTYYGASYAAGTAYLGAFGGDNEVNGGIRVKTIGSAPNRKFVIEWTQFYANWNPNLTNAGNLQAWLSETTGVINYVYGEIYNSSSSSVSKPIFISAGNTVTTAGHVLIGSPATFVPAATAANNTIAAGSGTTTGSPLIANLGSSANGSRWVYTFTPPSAVAVPTSMTFTAIQGSTTTVNWVDDSANELGFIVTRATDAGFTQNVVSNTVVSTTTAATGGAYNVVQNGLSFGTTYYYKIQSYTEGGVSSDLTGSQATTAGTLSGVKTIGPGGTYATLTAAFNDINTNGLNGDVELQLLSGYVSSAEPAFPVAASTATATGSFSVKLYPTVSGLSITSSSATGTLNLNGTGNLTIDGRVNQTGAADLIISNTATAGYAMQFINDARNNTVRYCFINGVNTSVSSGVIVFGTSNGISGNDNNTIANCDIRDGATTPLNLIYSSGSSSALDNSGNTITNNVFANYFGAAAASNGVFLSSNSSGWNISDNKFFQTSARTMTTGAVNRAINIVTSGGTGYTINNNVIGYANASATGTTAYSGSSCRFIGIDLTAGSSVASNIQGNTISGISVSSSSGGSTAAPIFGGIIVQGGQVNIGTTTGNTIGAATGTGAISVTGSTTGGLVTGIYATSSGAVSIQNNTIGSISATGNAAAIGIVFNAIQAAGSGVFTVTSNNIGSASTPNSITVGTSATTTASCSFFGIQGTATGTPMNLNSNNVYNVSNYGGNSSSVFNGVMANGQTSGVTVNMNSNIVRNNFLQAGTLSGINEAGSSSTTNIISETSNQVYSCSVAGAGIASNIYGIRGVTSSFTYNSNSIHDLAITANSGTVASSVYGAYNLASPTSETVNGNQIYNLSIAGSATGTNNTIAGVFLNTTSGTRTVSNNVMRDFTFTNSSTGSASVYGIYSVTSSPNIFRNKIYGLTATNGAASIVYGIFSSTGTTINIYNNLISNLSAPASSLTAPAPSVVGLYINSGTTLNASYNTVLITGSGGTNFGSAAIYASTTPTLTLRNNIFVNTSTPAGTGKAVAYQRSSATLTSYSTSSNNNLFYAGTPGAANLISFDGTTSNQTLAAHKTAMGTRDQASVTENPVFVSTTGSDATFLHMDPATPSFAESGGTVVAGVTDDFDGDVRNASTPDIGADEFAGTPIGCSGAAAGTIVANGTSFCVSGPLSITATGYSSGNGTIYQWQSSTDAGFTTPVNIGAATNVYANLNITVSASGYYRLRVTCPSASATSDSNTVQVTVTSPALASTTPGSRCGTGTVTLQATANPGESVQWFAANTGGSSLFTGTSFTTPSISATTTYYAAATTPPTPYNVPVGTATTLTGDTEQPTAFCNRWSQYKGQYVFTPAELNAAGVNAGPINSIAFTITTLGSGTSVGSYTVSMGTVASSTLTTTFVTGLTQVYGPQTYNHAVGVNTVTFTNPYVWDGVSNLVVEVKHTGANSSNNSQTYYTATTANSVIYQTGSSAMSDLTGTLSQKRLNITFNGIGYCSGPRTAVAASVSPPPALALSATSQTVCVSQSSSTVTLTSGLADYDSFVWSPAIGVSGSAATGYTFSANASTTFTLTASQTGGSQCSTSATFTLNISAPPTITNATATPTSLCSGAISTLSATVPAVTVPNYTLSGSAGTYVAISGTAANAIGDDFAEGSLPIGFTFTYNNMPFTTFAAASNGFIELGSSSSYVNNAGSGWTPSTNALAARANIIAPFWDDNNTTDGSIQYITTGSAGSRILTVQWTNMHVGGSGSATNPTISMQLKLYEGSNQVQFIYGSTSAALSSPTASVGLSGAVGSYLSVTPAASPASSTTSSTTENVSVTGTNVPSGTTFTFVPPVSSSITWSPIEGLYTDAGATTAYTGTVAPTVYAKVTAPVTYTATATSTANCTASQNVSITLNNPTVAPIDGSDDPLCVGDSVTLTSESPGGVWTSSNEDIATVSGGVVTAVGGGEVTIIYTVTDLGCSTSVTKVLTVNTPIESTNPIAQTVVTGSNASFSVNATGSVVSYQWMVSADGGDTFEPVADDEFYSGATTNTLTITNTPESLNGNLYMVVITAEAPCPPFESGLAVLNVGDTGIATDPASITICSSGTGEAQFTVVASGTVDAYAWQVDQGLGFEPITDGTVGGVTYSGATTDVLTVSGLTLANTGWNFQAIVTGPANGAVSNPATLTVNEGVAITTDPASANSCYSGGSAVFTVVASGAVAGYQWQYSTDNVTFNNVAAGVPVGATYSGATTASLTVNTTAATPAAGTYFYRAVVNGATPCGAVPSNGAQMQIYTPVIGTQPSPATVFAGNAATFTVSTSEPSPSYQWQYAASASGPWSNVVNNTPANITYANGTTATLTVNVLGGAVAAANRYYRAVVTSAGCSVNSDPALLTTTNYCFPTYTAGPGTVDQIANVTLSTLNNNSGPATSPYYTVYDSATVPDIQQLTTANISVKFGNDTANYCAVWIDFNHDGVFDASEGVASTASSAGTAVANGTSIVSIPVPLSAVPGKTRMRVRGGDDVAIGLNQACGASNDVDGEAEDYFVNIVAAPNCSGTPATATVSASQSSVCVSGSVVLTATNIPSGAIGLSSQWYNTVTGAIAGTVNSATYTTPVLTANASYFLRVTCADSGLFSDSNTVTITVNNPTVTSTSPATRCGIGTVSLGATGSAGTTLNWYAAASGGSSLGTGSNFTTPTISSNTTYYVEASIGENTVHVGPVSPAAQGGTTGSWTVGWNVNFTVASATTLKSVVIYPNTSGANGTFTVRNGTSTSGTVVSTINYTTNVAGGTTPQVLTFNVPLAAGTYNIYSDTLPSGGLTRNTSGAVYPYTSSVANITGNGYDQTYYMGLYDWTFGTGCSSARQAVQATVNTPPALTLSGASTTICAGTPSAPVTVTSNVADYDSYVWSPSAGVSGNAASGFIFNPASTTTYTLTASQTAGSQCQNVATYTVTVNPSPTVPVITPANATVCAGGITPLTIGASSSSSGTAILGNGTTAPGATSFPNPFSAWYGGAKHQMMFTASELIAQGLSAGSSISSVTLEINAFVAAGVCKDFTIRMGSTSNSALTGFVSGTTPVYGPTTFTPSATGLVTFTLTTPYIWNGTSNLIVETVHNAGNSGNGSGTTTRTTTTPTNTVYYGAKDGVAGGIAGFDAAGPPYTNQGASSNRPNMRFGFTASLVPTWAPTTGLYTDASATIPYSGGQAVTVYAKPATTTAYTATVTNGFSCPKASAPATITVNQYYDFYVDADGDHYGTGAPVSFCAVSASAAPAGYASVGGDCDDTLAAVNPGHAEVAFNGVDDNCNGTIDEGSQLFSQVLASQCGTTLASISSLIGAVSFGAPVDGYRFRVVNTTTNAVQTIDRTVPNFSMTMLASYDYATTYSISVMLRRNGIWLNYYGNACLVSTPAVLDPGGAAAVTPSQCGIVLPSISTLIATTSLPGVTAYRFRVTNLTDAAGPLAQQVIERNYHWFSLTMLTRFNYGTDYQVEVAVKTNGAWSGYGSPCNVTSPAVPMLTNCGATIASTSTYVATTSLNRVTAYRFEVTNMTTFEQIIVDRSQNWFTFTNVPNFVPGATYAVRVAVQTSGYWSPFGEACEVVAPGATRATVKGDDQPMVDFRAVAYPNPYLESFAIDMTSSSEEKVQVKVYDMIGKLLEDREFPIDRIEMQQFGERYPSGVYNIVVTQAGFVKTLRVIKR